MAKLYITISEEKYNKLSDLAVKLYGHKRGNKKKAIDRSLDVGILDMEKEIEDNKKRK